MGVTHPFSYSVLGFGFNFFVTKCYYNECPHKLTWYTSLMVFILKFFGGLVRISQCLPMWPRLVLNFWQSSCLSFSSARLQTVMSPLAWVFCRSRKCSSLASHFSAPLFSSFLKTYLEGWGSGNKMLAIQLLSAHLKRWIWWHPCVSPALRWRPANAGAYGTDTLTLDSEC